MTALPSSPGRYCPESPPSTPHVLTHPGTAAPRCQGPHPRCYTWSGTLRWSQAGPGLPSPPVATGRAEESQTFLWRHVGQGVVFAPFPSSVGQRGGGAEHDLRLVLLVALLGELGHLRREQVEECGVTVLADAVGGNGPFVHAQALPDDPALNQGVEPIILEDLGSRRSLEVSPQPRLPCSFSPHFVAQAGADAMLASVGEPGEPVKSWLQRQRSGWESPAPTPQVQAFKKGAAGTPRAPVSQPGWGAHTAQRPASGSCRSVPAA